MADRLPRYDAINRFTFFQEWWVVQNTPGRGCKGRDCLYAYATQVTVLTHYVKSKEAAGKAVRGGGRRTIDGQESKELRIQRYIPQRGSTKKPFFGARADWRSHQLRARKQHKSASLLSSGRLPSK